IAFFIARRYFPKVQLQRPLLQEGCGWSHRLSKALIYSKLRVAPFRDGFPASRLARRLAQLLMPGSRSVASWKNASCSGWSTTHWLPTTRVVTLAHSLPRPIDCLPRNTRRSRLATLLRATPMTTCPMSWAHSRTESCSLPRRAWRMTNGVIATSPKRRPHEGSHASNEASSGLAQKRHLQSFATTIWSSCMPGERVSPPLLTLLWPCGKYGPGEKSPVLKRSRAAWNNDGRPLW